MEIISYKNLRWVNIKGVPAGEDIGWIKKIFDTLSKDENLKAKYFGGNAGLLLHKILETKFEFVIKQMDYVVRKVDEVEDKIFKAKRRKLVESISLLQKEVVDIRRTQKPAAIILKALTSRAKELFGKDSGPYFTDL